MIVYIYHSLLMFLTWTEEKTENTLLGFIYIVYLILSKTIEEWSFTKTFTTIRHQHVTFSSILLTSTGQEYIYCQYNRLIRLYSDVVFYVSYFCHYVIWFDFWCFTPLSAISWGPVLVVEEEPPTMGSQLVNFITCGCESSAPFL